MKFKTLVLSTVALAISTLTFAQGVHIGAKGGVNITKIDGESFKDEFNFGYALGGFAEIYFSKKVGIQPEVMWNEYTARTATKFHDIYPESVSDLQDVHLNYLSIPLLLNYRPAKIITFQVGPQFGILINKDENLFQNGKDAFKSGDLSLLGGVQLNLGGLKLGGRYTVGLNNINDIDNKDEWKNQGFQLYVGVKIL